MSSLAISLSSITSTLSVGRPSVMTIGSHSRICASRPVALRPAAGWEKTEASYEQPVRTVFRQAPVDGDDTHVGLHVGQAHVRDGVVQLAHHLLQQLHRRYRLGCAALTADLAVDPVTRQLVRRHAEHALLETHPVG